MTSSSTSMGTRSTGESFSIGDPNEVWYMEMIGPGPAARGFVGRAPRSRWIYLRPRERRADRHFSFGRPAQLSLCEECDLVRVEKGYYDPKSGKPFSFWRRVQPRHPQMLATRRRACGVSSDERLVEGVSPLTITAAWRERILILSGSSRTRSSRSPMCSRSCANHYEGTPYDMTKGIDAGPYGTPNATARSRGTWTASCTRGNAPSRHSRPGIRWCRSRARTSRTPSAGVLWYGVDDTYTTCYVPLYCQIEAIPRLSRSADSTSFRGTPRGGYSISSRTSRTSGTPT